MKTQSSCFPRVVVDFKSVDADRLEKLTTWDDVYEIKARVEGEFAVLREKIAEDVAAPDEAAFLARLTQVASAKAGAYRLTPLTTGEHASFLQYEPWTREAERPWAKRDGNYTSG